MSDEMPQLYLVTPPRIDLDTFPDLLGRVLDANAVACLRVALATRDEDRLLRAADALRAVTEPREVALVVADHYRLAKRAGLDGVHLGDGARRVRKAREELGQDAVVGAFCGTSRHDGMQAGEAGADYVSFGPVGGTDLGDGARAEPELFSWWSEMIEIPVIAEGALDPDLLARLSGTTDFVAFGEEIWETDAPAETLSRFRAAL